MGKTVVVSEAIARSQPFTRRGRFTTRHGDDGGKTSQSSGLVSAFQERCFSVCSRTLWSNPFCPVNAYARSRFRSPIHVVPSCDLDLDRLRQSHSDEVPR